MEEESTLISEEGLQKSTNYPRTWFLLSKILPFIVFYIFRRLKSNSTFSFIMFVASMFVDFYITKNIGGPELIGLGWYVATELGTNSFMQFVSKPYPYVPERVSNNIFWLSIVSSTGLWITNIIVSIFQRDFYFVFLALVGIIVQIVNCGLFMHGHTLLQKEIVKIVRLGEEDPLNLAKEKGESSDGI